MTLEDMMKLVNAGFTKAEIQAMAGASAPEPEKVPEPIPEPARQESVKEPAGSGADPRSDGQNSVNDQIAALTSQVSQLTQIVQKSNLLMMQQPEVKPQTGEDIIASIIFPTYKPDDNKK